MVVGPSTGPLNLPQAACCVVDLCGRNLIGTHHTLEGCNPYRERLAPAYALSLIAADANRGQDSPTIHTFGKARPHLPHSGGWIAMTREQLRKGPAVAVPPRAAVIVARPRGALAASRHNSKGTFRPKRSPLDGHVDRSDPTLCAFLWTTQLFCLSQLGFRSGSVGARNLTENASL